MPQRAHAPPPRRPAIRLGGTLRVARRRLSALAAMGTRLARHRLAELMSRARRRVPRDLQARLDRWRDEARDLARPYTHDAHEILPLVVLPVLLMAAAIIVHEWMRTRSVPLAAVATPEQEIAPLGPGAAHGMTSLAALPRSVVREAVPDAAHLSPVLGIATDIREASPAGAPLAAMPPDNAATRVVAPSTLRPGSAMAALPPILPQPSRSETTLAVLTPAGDRIRRVARAIAPAPLPVFEMGADGAPLPARCVAAPAPRMTAAPPSGTHLSLDREAFGLRLAEAAESQVGRLVIYNEAYRRIAYPMGDVHEMYGVCTDVIVRAYRALGLDLQALVHEARTGTGDTSIDHRRTDVLRRFFAARGDSLPVTTFAEDYLPGDIVTYDRPHNRRTRAHIAIVASVLAPSGRPMIVHNRGWGPELEDALFVDRITGHYRYRGPGTHRSAVRQASAGAADAIAP